MAPVKRQGVWLLTTEHGTRHLIDRTAHLSLRIPEFHEGGHLNLVETDGKWQHLLDMTTVRLGEPVRLRGPHMSDVWTTSRVVSWRPLPGAVMLADGGVVVHSGYIPTVHSPADCESGPHRKAGCWIHRPSAHKMTDWPVEWDDFASVAERLCSHGIGHPDPDHLAYAMELAPRPGQAEHSCDGCCA